MQGEASHPVVTATVNLFVYSYLPIIKCPCSSATVQFSKCGLTQTLSKICMCILRVHRLLVRVSYTVSILPENVSAEIASASLLGNSFHILVVSGKNLMEAQYIVFAPLWAFL